MAKHRQPSMQWSHGHGVKMVHYTWLSAWMHAFKLNLLPSLGGKRLPGMKKWAPYKCLWGQNYLDGETAPPHYHVGRPGRYTP